MRRRARAVSPVRDCCRRRDAFAQGATKAGGESIRKTTGSVCLAVVFRDAFGRRDLVFDERWRKRTPGSIFSLLGGVRADIITLMKV